MATTTDPLDEIRLIASVETTFAPESARKLLAAIDGMNLCRQHPDMMQFLANEQHAHRCYLANCEESRQHLNKLALLVYEHLPEVLPLEYVEHGAHWRHDDPATPWPEIVKELRRIKVAAITKILKRKDAARVSRISVDLADCTVTIDQSTYEVKANQAEIIDALVAANGEYVALGSIGGGRRSRDLNGLREEINSLIERNNKGVRIPREKLWLA